MKHDDALLDALLERYHHDLDTRAVIVSTNAFDGCVDLLRLHLGTEEAAAPPRWAVLFDENTHRVAGERLDQALREAGIDWEGFRLQAPQGHQVPICDDAAVATMERQLALGGFTGAIAVGAGTINDIVKLAAHHQRIPMACVATAPSMNGYTSTIAAVLSDGVKTTVPCTAPRVVVADLDVMAEAPYRMIASGLGDLISKPVSNADWLLSARLNDTHHCAEAMAVIEQGAALLEGVAPDLPRRDRHAVGGLTRSLILSGLAMTIAGSSSPASGGEHLISHFLDMTAYAFDQPHDFHGCQVGVGTLTTALLYERLRALDPSTIDPEARAAALLPWPNYRRELQQRFGPLFDAVVAHAEPGYPSPQQLCARLERLVARWDEVMQAVGQTLRTRASIEAELNAAQAPTRFSDLGVDRDRARRAILHSKDIRNRYTILHLAWELGTLEAWGQEALDALY